MFNNKKFVIALALVAAYIFYDRVVVTIFTSGAPAIAVADAGYDVFFDEDTGLMPNDSQALPRGRLAISKVDVAKLSWNTSPARDPFSPQLNDDTSNIAAQIAKATSTPAVKAVRRLPIVSAIVRSENRDYAVIDGDIRAKGELSGGYRVAAIREISVVLTDIETKRTHEVTVQP